MWAACTTVRKIYRTDGPLQSMTGVHSQVVMFWCAYNRKTLDNVWLFDWKFSIKETMTIHLKSHYVWPEFQVWSCLSSLGSTLNIALFYCCFTSTIMKHMILSVDSRYTTSSLHFHTKNCGISSLSILVSLIKNSNLQLFLPNYK